MKKKRSVVLAFLLGILLIFSGCKHIATIQNSIQSVLFPTETTVAVTETDSTTTGESTETTLGVTVQSGSLLSLDDIPAYSGSPYIEINGNQPDFTKSDLTTESYEYYSPLDRLGRCGECVACVGTDLMPTEKRGSISSIKPTGWQKYTFDFVNGGSLYNRCHLIAHQLAGEDANRQNLITGTRYLNETGMLPFEEAVGNYVRASGKHVLYRVTPLFKEDELVARGVQMEGYSVEDKGKSICYNVYCYNVQPGVIIDYATGEAAVADDAPTSASTAKTTATTATAATSDTAESTVNAAGVTYVLNVKGKKFHRPDCEAVSTISDKNKADTDKTREELIAEGYTPCGTCQP